jgi:kinesin family member 1
LGIVIEKLAYNCQHKKADYIPYRNSLLTHILSESLSGNSKTFMIAAISPADDNYEESLGTLRFAQRASLITTKSKKNVTAKEGYNKELLEEIERLKKELENAKATVIPGEHSHSVSVEYITVEKEAALMDGRIAQMMQDLDTNIHERESLEAKLHELEEEKKSLEMEKSKKELLDPEK